MKRVLTYRNVGRTYRNISCPCSLKWTPSFRLSAYTEKYEIFFIVPIESLGKVECQRCIQYKVTFRCTKKTTSFWGDTCENKGKNVFEKILSKANYLKLSSFTTHAIFFDGNFGEIQCCKKADLLRNWAHSSLFCHVPFQEILKTFFMAQKTHRMSHFYNGFLFVPMTDHWLLRKTRSTNSNCPLLWEEKIKVISTCITTWYDKRRGHQFYVKSQDRTMAKNE